MRSLIDGAINWEEISRGKIDKSEYRYQLGQGRISKETGVLTLPVTLNFIIPCDDYIKIKEIIKAKIPELRGVTFSFTYNDLVLDPGDIVRLYVPYMIQILNGPYDPFTKTINRRKICLEGDSLKIYALGKTAVKQLNEKVSTEFERMLSATFGLKVNVEFFVDEEDYLESIRDFSESEMTDISKSVEKYKTDLTKNAAPKPKETENSFQKGGQSKGQWRRKEVPAQGNNIMGHPINGEANAKLTNIDPSMGTVIVEGMLFKKDFRVIKSGSYLVSLLITDNKTTVLSKAFVSKEKWEEIDSMLPSGTYVKIQGEVQFDTFENMNSIMFKEIEKLDKKTGRQDTYEGGKRVELHLHTKMSQMDGMNEVDHVVKQAQAWGQPAVAITDHGVVQSFPDAFKAAQDLKKKEKDIKIIYGVEGYVFDDSDCINPDGSIDYKKKPVNHIIILAKNQAGLKNIYKLVSYSHLDYFYKKPRLPWSLIEQYRDGLIIGSACCYGEVLQSLVKRVYIKKKTGQETVYDAKTPEEQERIASRYDYLEIQPVVNNAFMLEEEYYLDGKKIQTENDIRELNKRIIDLADRLGKPCVATTDSHYSEPDDAIYRNIIMAGMGFEDAENGQGLYMKTTDEMMQEFSYLGDRAKEIVIDNTIKIADMCDESIRPVPTEKCPPRIAGAKETLRNSCMENAHRIYGDPLPDVIQERLDKELNSVIDNGYAVMYVSAKMLVDKSMSDGYLVGSRGSVGSSFAATMAGITEVNPLDPHYLCPECKTIEWGDMSLYDCGIDMPPKKCPKCGCDMKRDGFTIPFATFLGFNGDKEPDIDLNFAGEYQPIAHRYVGEIFGEKNVFKAGTVGTVADKTAYGYVMKYFEERQIPINKYEADRLATSCTGVKRTTGQHPGGIVICPDDREIFEFCPIQHPANDTETDIVTTHFDYHKIDENLLKLDILGHDIPSMIRQLQDMTGVDPMKADLTDRKVLSIFNGIEALDIKDPDYKYVHGTYAIPEFGTSFVRQMLDDTKPDKFADLVRISGFSHGTDVWLNNAQEYIRTGQATMREVISTRDDIMNYLILKGVENQKAFKIMEIVRKGKKDLDEDQVKTMKEHGVPDWYIDSCNKIKYMFPRAHAVAYTMMSFRMAWYKVYYPAEFYATYFTTKIQNFDAEVILKGKQAVLDRIDEINNKGTNASAKEKDDIIILEVAYEMYARGLEFKPARLGHSLAAKFWVEDGKVMIPFAAINGVGENAAISFVQAFKDKPFDTIEEATIRGKLNKSVVQALKDHGVFEGLPETDQLSMF